MKKLVILSVMLLALATASSAWAYPSVFPHGTTIYKPDKAYSGYTLFCVDNFGAFLIDMRGDVVREWKNVGKDHPVKMLPGGHVMGCTGNEGRVVGHEDSNDMAIVDWNDVPTYSEFEILAEAFTKAGVPTIIADPRDLELVESGSRRTLRSSSDGRPIDLVYRRVLINDIIARPHECRALVEAYEHRLVCVANSLRCKIPHKKAFFAVLTDERRAYLFSDRERELIRRHVPRTILVREDAVPYLRAHRERLVIKPNDEYGGTGVTLGWETDGREWDRAIDRAVAERARGWVAQEKIMVRREPFPVCTSSGVEVRDMLVDFAPYLFRGKLAGFLTRLSATGLANVTSGGGQVPAFVTASTI